MRILVYGMQSSGASLFTFFLAQKPKTFAIINFWEKGGLPNLENLKPQPKNIVIKYLISKKISLNNYIKNFNPDKTILFIRNPFDNYSSLKEKWYANRGGSIFEKFKILEDMFKNRKKFDLVVFYEDFVFNTHKVLKQLEKLNFGVKKDFFKFKRTKQDILKFNLKYPELNEKLKGRYGFGNIHFKLLKNKPKIINKWVFKIIRKKDKEKIMELCPTVCEFYKRNFPNLLNPRKDILLKNKIYSEIYGYVYYIVSIVNKNIGRIGLFLKKHFPKLYFKLKKLRRRLEDETKNIFLS